MKRNLKLHAQNVSSRNRLLVNIIHFFVNSKTLIWTWTFNKLRLSAPHAHTDIDLSSHNSYLWKHWI